MISISHHKAQFLLRRAADRKLPEEQWAALQAHLEGCAACRAYQVRLDHLQKGLRRELRSRWRVIDPPPIAGLASTLADIRRARQVRTQRLFVAALVLLAIVLLAVSGLPGSLSTAALQPTQTAAPVLPIPTSTPLPGNLFQGLVAFESRRSGDSEIYLIQAAGGEHDLTNLTQHPADDRHPAWSPDGEWLAFLSDRTADGRAAGKHELYVISVAGSRLTQITDAPEIEWEGPLEWSPDGKWISLLGRRVQQNDDLWSYLVSVEGGGPVSLPGSRGVSREDINTGVAWDYLYYAQPPLSGYFSANQIDVPAETLRSLVPHPESPMAAVLREDERGSGCQKLDLLYPAAQYRARFIEVQQLCVAGDIVRASWALNRSWDSGAWLVMAAEPAADTYPEGASAGSAPDEGSTLLEGGSLPSERSSLSEDSSLPSERSSLLSERSSLGVYALKVPYLLTASQPWPQERLADLEPGEAPAFSVRPAGESLDIRPVAAVVSKRTDSQPFTPPSRQGSLLLVEAVPGPAQQSAVVAMRPDGSERRTLLPATASHTCPSWSPDRTRIAFLSDRTTRGDTRGPDEVFLLDVRSREITQLTRMALSGRVAESLLQRFSCPVWSPDGQYLATVSEVGQGSAVLVLNENGQVLRNALISRPAQFTDLVWTPDGQSIILAQPAQSANAPRIVRVPWRQPVASSSLLNLEGWEDIHALSLSPDGEQMAFIIARYGKIGLRRLEEPMEAQLRVVSLPDMEILIDKRLPHYTPYMLRGLGRIAWLPGKQLVYAIPQGPLDRYKALLLRYDPAEDTVQQLALVEDQLYDWALNGAWLVYSSESGLWGVPVEGRFDAPISPVRLSDTAADSVHWR